MAKISALLKSAQATRTSISNYNDSIAAYDFANSAYTDDALAQYTDYLNSRMNALSGDASISAATKRLTLTKSLDSATKSNITATIQRENIQVLAGNATPTDKYNIIAAQYIRAVNNGDMTLAQSLESQAYSLSQQIQYQAQQSADAAKALNASNATTAAGNASQNIQNLEAQFRQLNATIPKIGKTGLDSAVSSWLKGNEQAFKDAGIVLKPGTQPNYFDLVHGIQAYEYNQNMIAADALQATNPNGAQDKRNAAMAIASGATPISTLAGSMTASDVIAASDPNSKMYEFNASSGKFEKTQVGGVAYGTFNTADPNDPSKIIQVFGQHQTYTGSTVVQSIDPQMTIQLKALGLNYSAPKGTPSQVSGSNGVAVEATNKTDPAIRKIINDSGNLTTAYFNPDLNNPNSGPNGMSNNQKGGLQFVAGGTGGDNGTGQNIYSVVYDKNGRKQVYESGGYADTLIHSDPGFDVMGSSAQRRAGEGFFGKVKNDFIAGVKNTASLFGGAAAGHNPSSLPGAVQRDFTGNLIQVAQGRQQQMQAQAMALQAAQAPAQQPALQGIPAALPPIPAYQAPPVDVNQIPATAHINVAPNIAPTANISINPAPVQGKFLGVSNKPNTGKISF